MVIHPGYSIQRLSNRGLVIFVKKAIIYHKEKAPSKLRTQGSTLDQCSSGQYSIAAIHTSNSGLFRRPQLLSGCIHNLRDSLYADVFTS